ncbi:DUF1822 family protein [Spirulina sp. CS-785/01]|uniref:DUF1822 family protein n=1 Tax=Spirulina sp. CS-785/01 TaxID=3021716 RepID=UPI002330C697|nr:DUF1822 family protein [Spirulina sp. CS-785/01]MDB9313359.1 DUF1822 family protein [Spirulina sp. CS-785/01]
MMTNPTFPSITIPLGREAHEFARQVISEAMQFAETPQKQAVGKRVYLNSLAVYAVQSYCKWQFIECEFHPHGGLFAYQDIAPLTLTHIGTIECRPVQNPELFSFPPEATEDRLGYLFVQFSESLTEGELLGFMPRLDITVSSPTIYRNQLQSLDEFIDYLFRLETATNLLTQGTDPIIQQVREQLSQFSLTEIITQLEQIYRQDPPPEQPYLVQDVLSGQGQVLEMGIQRETQVEESVVSLNIEVIEQFWHQLKNLWSQE